MKKLYFLNLFFVLAFFTAFSGFSQNNAIQISFQQNTIEDLSIYPNPANSGKTLIYITSKLNLTKKIEFYDILGKQIFSTVLAGKELSVSNLSKGVYVIKVTENNISETRKLVIK